MPSGEDTQTHIYTHTHTHIIEIHEQIQFQETRHMQPKATRAWFKKVIGIESEKYANKLEIKIKKQVRDQKQ